MNIYINHPYRRADFEEWIKKYRNVPNLSLETNHLDTLSGARTENVSSGLSPYQGDWNSKTSTHLLSRCLFGVKKEEVQKLVQLGLNDAVELLLSTAATPDPPVNNYSGWDDLPPDPDVAPGQTWIEAPEGDFTASRIISLKTWVLQQSFEATTIREKMILFFQTLLPTLSWSVFFSKASYQYYEMLNRNHLGNYKQLINELTTDSAMLLFLNGAYNNKYSPDENYARELQELFTLGKGAGSQFTEQDVREAARVLTGWTINWDDWNEAGRFESFFNSELHDEEDKEFSSFFNNRIITGKSGEAGANETGELIDMIFEKDEVSLYICRRIYNFFVYPEISSNVETLVIEPLAKLFRDSNYELKPVMKTLLSSEHFYDAAIQRSVIKNPADFLIGTLRVFDLKNPEPDNIRTAFDFNAVTIWNMSGWGMELCDPPNVAGWNAYYQFPIFDKSWITTDTIVKRARLMDAATFWGYWINEDFHPAFDFIPFIQQFDSPEDANLLLDQLISLLMSNVLEESRAKLLDILLSGTGNPGYWAQAWYAFEGEPNETNRGVVENRLKLLFQQIFQLGEYQLM